MRYPYSSEPIDALFAAQTATGLVLAGVLWHRSLRPRAANALLLGAVALAVLAPVGTAPFAESSFLHAVGTMVGAGFAKPTLKVAAALATASALLTRRRGLSWVAGVGQALLWLLTDFIQDCDADLAAAHVAFFGALIGLHVAWTDGISPSVPAPPVLRRPWREDLGAFLVASVAAAVVCRVVERGWTSGADEWANTYAAALFANLHAYGKAPPCGEEFRSFWVFQLDGRAFAQYTPGWPYFMTPFVALGAPWVSGPAAFGLLTAAIARLARRAAGPSTLIAAGRFAAAATVLSATMLENGASRYAHVFVAATFAWSLEALCAASDPSLPDRERRRWALVLGGSAAWLLSTRPLDGATLGLGLTAVFLHALARRDLGLSLVAWAALPFAAIGGLTLVVLRLQLGRWWTTGYSLTSVTFPWATFGWSLPKADQYRWGLPLAAATYCAWPASLALGLAGMALVRGPARRVVLACGVGCGALVVAYTLSEFGRRVDFGFGPRYDLPCIVPLAIGTGVLFARLGARTGEGLARYGPAALSLAAAVGGVLFLAPRMYPYARLDVERHNWLRPTLDAAHLHHAVVFAGTVPNSHALDLCENLPLDLYPNQDVLLAIDRGEQSLRCVHEAYPDRALYRASFGPPVAIVPLSPPGPGP